MERVHGAHSVKGIIQTATHDLVLYRHHHCHENIVLQFHTRSSTTSSGKAHMEPHTTSAEIDHHAHVDLANPSVVGLPHLPRILNQKET